MIRQLRIEYPAMNKADVLNYRPPSMARRQARGNRQLSSGYHLLAEIGMGLLGLYFPLFFDWFWPDRMGVFVLRSACLLLLVLGLAKYQLFPMDSISDCSCQGFRAGLLIHLIVRGVLMMFYLLIVMV